MAKRKHQNLEIERQLQQRKKVYQVVGFIVAAIVVMAISASIWAYRDRQTVMRYDGGRVATSDFRAVWELHDQFHRNPAARQAALDSTKAIVVLRDRAVYHNVDLTPEERADAVQNMADWRQWERNNNGFDIMGFISNERLAELFTTSPLNERLQDIYVPYYTPDPEELAELVEEHIEENFHDGMDLQVLFLSLVSYEEINEAYSLVGTMDFVEIVRQFTEEFDEESEINHMSLTGLIPILEGMGITPEDLEFLLNMEEGEYSHIITVMDFEFTGEPVYVIFKMVSISEADVEAITAEIKEVLVRVRRDEIFFDIVQDWVDEANFTVNQRGYNSI